ncbi:MAG: nucleotidyltransferase domain-containing protein, partial [Nanoarchaeota archaeon]
NEFHFKVFSVFKMKQAWQSESGSRILAFFCRNAGKAYYAKEIANATGLSTGATHQACLKLSVEKYLNRVKRGKEFFYSFNYSHAPARSYKVFVTLLDFQPVLDKLAPLSKRVILYGSAAVGLDGFQSDVDVLVESDNSVVEKVVRGAMDRNNHYSIKLKTTSELMDLKKKDASFYENAILRGLKIYENI